MTLSPSQLHEFIIAEDPIVYHTLASSAFIFWDFCITIRQEVELIWRSKFSVISLLYYSIRYLVLGIKIVELVFYTNISGLIRPSTANCVDWLWFEVISIHLSFVCVEILLLMRVFAFYGRSKRMLVGLCILFACANTASVVILVITVPKMLAVTSPLPPHIHAGVCLSVYLPPLFFNYWFPGLIFETILFILVIVRYIQTRHPEIGRPHLLIVFVRDGVWAFALIFAVTLGSALTFKLAQEKGDIVLAWLISVLGFCGSRIILNLRSAAREHTGSTLETGIQLSFLKDRVSGTYGPGIRPANTESFEGESGFN